MTNCLMTFPATTVLDTRCPRCSGEAGDHPAPMSLLVTEGQALRSGELPVNERPTLREALAAQS